MGHLIDFGHIAQLRDRAGCRIIMLCVLALFMVAAFFFSLSCGSLKISYCEIVQAIIEPVDNVNRQIIWNIRIPRTVTGALVGICLALAGAVLQGVMRNPLAGPNLIGVTSGGGLAAIIILIVLPEYIHLLVPGAFIGALCTTIVIYLLAWKHGVQPMRLILAGIAVSSLLGAVMSSLMLFFPDRVAGTIDFMIGGLSARSWRHVNIIWPYAIVGSVAVFGMARRLNIMSLGDEVAGSLGVNVEISRMILIAISALLAAAAVSVAGLLGFVGLMVPHIMRLVVGSDHRFLFPACILFSAGLMMFCDTVGRLVLDPVELPVGIIMAFLGAPFFLFLLRSKKHHAA